MSGKRQLYGGYAVVVFLVVYSTLTFLYNFILNNHHVIRSSESLDVVAYSVYFDMRAEANHRNATVILASVYIRGIEGF